MRTNFGAFFDDADRKLVALFLRQIASRMAQLRPEVLRLRSAHHNSSRRELFGGDQS